jgi:hypothetical protein
VWLNAICHRESPYDDFVLETAQISRQVTRLQAVQLIRAVPILVHQEAALIRLL